MEAAGRTVVVEQVGEAGGGLVLEDFVLLLIHKGQSWLSQYSLENMYGRNFVFTLYLQKMFHHPRLCAPLSAPTARVGHVGVYRANVGFIDQSLMSAF